MEKEIVEEKQYQEAKKSLNKKNDYFTYGEMNNLMQFLMQRQEENIKNEVKI